MTLLEKLEFYNGLFEVVEQFVFSSGGDGDGYIISENYLELANAFEMYEKRNKNWFTNRYDYGEGLIAFSNNQEVIFFTKDRTKLPNWKSDIVVEIF